MSDTGRRSGKALAIDLGSRRIGLSVSDRAGTMAFPHSVVERSNDPGADRRAIAAAVEETGAETVVVGLPLSLDGTDGPAARAARAEADELADLLGATVVLFDERLTTVSAHSALVAAGRKGRDRRAVVDSAAATVLLQSWLDAGRPGG